MIAARFCATLLLVLAVSACGGDPPATRVVQTPAAHDDGGGAARLRAYVHETSRLFDRVLAARRRWERADGLSAIRHATEGVLFRERTMLRNLRATTAPAEVGDRHTRMIAELVARTRALRRLCAAPRLDTDAVDTQVGQTFAIEQIVNELFTL